MPAAMIGQLRTRLEIQREVRQRDAHGSIKPSWTTAVIRWAAVETLSGRELVEAQRTDSRVTHKVTLRFWPELTGKHRFRMKHEPTRIFNISWLSNPAQRGEFSVAICSEVSDG